MTAQQLTLDVVTPLAVEAKVTEVDMVEAIIRHFNDDPRQAVRELLLDADFLRDQLYIASQLLSQGISRGWRPKYERPLP